MKTTLLAFGLLLVTHLSFAQFTCYTPASVPVPITPSGSSQGRVAEDACYIVKVYFHFVRRTDGSGGQPVSILPALMNNLATTFNPHRISFVNTGNDEIRNSYYLAGVYETKYDKAKLPELVKINRVAGAVNIYLLDDNSLNGGYNETPAMGIVLGGQYSRLGVNGTIQDIVPSLLIAHEMGHCLGLAHTFETSDCAERADGSNCSTCGDLVCDTPADAEAFNFKEDVNCNWTISLTDSRGTAYRPDSRNLMTYVRPSCYQGFTAGQGKRMRNRLGTDKTLINLTTQPTMTGPDRLCSSAAVTYALSTGFNVTWTASPSSLFTVTSGTGATFNTSAINGANGAGTITATYTNGTCSYSLTRTVKAGIVSGEYTMIPSYACTGSGSSTAPVTQGGKPLADNEGFCGCPGTVSITLGGGNYSSADWNIIEMPVGTSVNYSTSGVTFTNLPANSMVRFNTTITDGACTRTFTGLGFGTYCAAPSYIPFSVSPNPSNSQVTIQPVAAGEPLLQNMTQAKGARAAEATVTQDKPDAKAYAVRLLDNMNKPVKEVVYSNGQPVCSLPLQGVPPGLYVLRVYDGKQWWTYRLIVQ